MSKPRYVKIQNTFSDTEIPESQETKVDEITTSKTNDENFVVYWKCSESIDFEDTKHKFWILKYRMKLWTIIKKKHWSKISEILSNSCSDNFLYFATAIFGLVFFLYSLSDFYLEKSPIYESTRIYYNFYQIFKFIKSFFILTALYYYYRVFNKVYKVIWVNNKVAKKNNIKTAKGLYNNNLYLNFVHSYPMLANISLAYFSIKLLHPSFHFNEDEKFFSAIYMLPKSIFIFYCYQEIWIICFEFEKMLRFSFCVCESKISKRVIEIKPKNKDYKVDCESELSEIELECKPLDEDYKVKLLFDSSLTAAKIVRERLDFLITFALFVQSISLFFPITGLQYSLKHHSEKLTTSHQTLLCIWILFNISILSYTFRRLTKIPNAYLDSVQLFKIQSLHWKEKTRKEYCDSLKPYFEIIPHLSFTKNTLAAVLILSQMVPYLINYFSFVPYGPNTRIDSYTTISFTENINTTEI